MKQQKIVKKVYVKNELGLHTRPAALIVKLLQDVKSDVLFTYNGETVNAKSILSILILAAPKDACISIQVAGEDAKMTMQRLVDNFENCFGEAPRCKKPVGVDE